MSKDTAKTETVILPDEVIKHIPFDDIFVDYEWNVRSKAEVMSESSDGVRDSEGKSTAEGTGLYGLILDMYLTGQDDPVVLRRVDGNKTLGGQKTEKPYELICGFRRTTAAMMANDKAQLAEVFKWAVEVQKQPDPSTRVKGTIVPNTADGTVRAVIRTLTPSFAKILNTKENTQRNNLTTPDLVRRVADFRKTEKMTQNQIAQALGITQGYVSRLDKISNLPKIVLQHWRGEPVKLPGLPDAVYKRRSTEEMADFADLSKEENEGEIVNRYVLLLNPPAPVDGADSSSDGPAKKIEALGLLIGTLVRTGVLENGSLSWAVVIGPKKDGFAIDTGKVDAVKRQFYWDLMQKSFEAGLADPKKAPKTQKDKDEAAAN